MGFRPAEQRERRDLAVKTACVIGLVSQLPWSPKRQARRVWRGTGGHGAHRLARGMADDEAEGEQ